MFCIARECRDRYIESGYQAVRVYLYGGLSLCKAHIDLAQTLETRNPSELTHRTLLFAIDNEPTGDIALLTAIGEGHKGW